MRGVAIDVYIYNNTPNLGTVLILTYRLPWTSPITPTNFTPRCGFFLDSQTLFRKVRFTMFHLKSI